MIDKFSISNILRAYECSEDFYKHDCKNCPYGFQHYDDSGDNAYWTCNFDLISQRMYQWLAIFNHIAEDEEKIAFHTAQSLIDQGIQYGAQLAAMHGSDATSQDLEKSYWQGFEDGYKKGKEEK